MGGYHIACIGELLIDFVCTDIGLGLKQGARFLKKAGGPPLTLPQPSTVAAATRSWRRKSATIPSAISCCTPWNLRALSALA